MTAKTAPNDVRYRPLYTLSDMARYARLPAKTLRNWSAAAKKPLVLPADPSSRSPFSFVNLVEAHVLVGLRRGHRLKMSSIRSAVDYLRRNYGRLHPLAELDLETDGREVFVREQGNAVSASAGGQRTFPEIVDRYLKRIERDPQFGPIRFFPLTYDLCPMTIVMDPKVAFGRPVIAGTRVSTTMIFERYAGGESLNDIAEDYALGLPAIEEALRCEIDHRAA